MFFFQIIFISLTIFLISKYFLKKKNILITKISNPHQKLAGTKDILQIGGIIFLFNIIFFHEHFNLSEIIFFSLLLILGILSDTDIFPSPKKRLLLQSLLVFIFVYMNGIYIDDLKIEFLNSILLNEYTKYFFITFCILVLLNGSNFIDGCNGLNIGYFLILLIAIFILLNQENISYDKDKIIILLIILSVLLILNLINLIYLGDSGAYGISFIVGITLIDIYMMNKNISPYFVAITLWYPAFENLFSIIRKKIYNSDVTQPDTSHLHQLLFILLKKRLVNFNHVNNQLTSVIILSYNLLTILISTNYFSHTKILVSILIFNIFVYLISYILLKKALLH